MLDYNNELVSKSTHRTKMEPADWALGAIVVGMFAVPIALTVWVHRKLAQREAYLAAHPHPEVEPPTPRPEFRYVDRDEFTPRTRKAATRFHQRVFECSPAADHAPGIGDALITIVSCPTAAGPKRTPLVARVISPRETYVRARLIEEPELLELRGLRYGEMIDIPRTAIASVHYLTGTGT